MKKTDFPNWAPSSLIESYIERQDLNKLIDDSISWGESATSKPRGLLGTPSPKPDPDPLAFKSRCVFRERWIRWYNEEGKLLTHSDAEEIWETIKKVGMEPDFFMGRCLDSYTGDKKEKLNFLKPKERKDNLENIVNLSENLSSALYGTSYDTKLNNLFISEITLSYVDLIQKTLTKITDENLVIEIRDHLESFLDDGKCVLRPLSFQLSMLASLVTSVLASDHCSGVSYDCLDETGADYECPFIPAPPILQRHNSAPGHRTQFYKNLAFFMNYYTGNPRPTLVAKTTALIFCDLGDIEPNYITKNWRN